MKWTERLTAAYKNFPLAPPEYPGAPYRPRLPEPPYEGAPGWKCSVYYYWWEYLRRHTGYRQTCERGGDGEHADLFEKFGDVHATDFHDWWWKHLWLFTFVSEAQDVPRHGKFYQESEGIFFHVGYARSRTQMLDAVREAFKKIPRERMEHEMRRQYRLYPTGRPRLRSLHQHLLVWDAKQANPHVHDADLADIAGIDVKHGQDERLLADMRERGEYTKDIERQIRRAKQLAVQRHLRIASQYIGNVVKGEFPLRDKR